MNHFWFVKMLTRDNITEILFSQVRSLIYLEKERNQTNVRTQSESYYLTLYLQYAKYTQVPLDQKARHTVSGCGFAPCVTDRSRF